MRPLSRRTAVVTAVSAAVATLLTPTLVPSAGAVPTPAIDRALDHPVRAAVSGWTAVSGPVDSTTTPAFVRGTVPSQSTIRVMRLVWPQRDPDGTWSIRSRQVLNGGAGPTFTVLSGWHDLNTRLAGVNGRCGDDGHYPQWLLFSGNRTTDSTDPLSQGVVFGAASDSGESWTVDTGSSFSSTRQAVSTYGLSAVEAACDQVLAAFTSGSSTHASFHLGPETGIPAATPDGATADTGSGVKNVTAVRRPTPSGDETWVLWASYGSSATDAGIHAQRVLPSLGPVLHAPGSAKPDGTVTLDAQPIGAATASDGALWVAYRDASTSTSVRLWKVGTSTTQVIGGKQDVQHVSLTSSPTGVLWAAIVDAAGTRPNPSLRAVRVRVTATGSCRVVTPIAAPTRKGSYTNVWQVGAAPRIYGTAALGGATGELLQLWLNASIGSDDRLWTASVFPGLQLKVKTVPTPLRADTGGQVRVSVADACDPMVGATVSVKGAGVPVAVTDLNGVAIVKIPPKSLKKGVHTVVVQRPGYDVATATIRVR